MVRGLAAVLAVAGWVVVLRGLWFAPVSSDPVQDLEAGGGFAANVEVYLPALALTLFFVVLVVVAATRRAWGVPALVVGVTTMAFAAWTLSRGYLLDHRPSLDTHLLASLALAGVATIIGVSALGAASEGARTSSDPA